jgi:hypothetical protein
MRRTDSGMNYQQRNRALFECIRAPCERTGCNSDPVWVHPASFTSNLMFGIQALFFRKAPLCMSSHDAVADDSCSDRFKKFPEHPKNNSRGTRDKCLKSLIVDPAAVCFFNDPFKIGRGLIFSDPKPGLIFRVIQCFPDRRIFQAGGNVNAEKV